MPESTCIGCPVGCRITVAKNEAGYVISGQGCKRGETYAISEAVSPQRMLTGVVGVKGRNRPLPVKTAIPVPKEKIWEVMKEIQSVRVTPPVKTGRVVKADLAGTGVALVATKSVE